MTHTRRQIQRRGWSNRQKERIRERREQIHNEGELPGGFGEIPELQLFLPKPQKHFLRLSQYQRHGYDEESIMEGLKAKNTTQ
ncbi:11505_t:CDS:2 [Funneliformis geosporum]|nr:11505_t:CDS:2 [Funneliformis geosporum]